MMIDRKSTRLNSSHTVIYTLSLHDALPISACELILTIRPYRRSIIIRPTAWLAKNVPGRRPDDDRSEEHTSELQSHRDLHSFPTRRSSDLGLRTHIDDPAVSPLDHHPADGLARKERARPSAG